MNKRYYFRKGPLNDYKNYIYLLRINAVLVLENCIGFRNIHTVFHLLNDSDLSNFFLIAFVK